MVARIIDICQYSQVMKLIETIQACCPVIREAPLSERDAERVASAFKAIADPARLRILSLIGSSPTGEGCVCDLTPALGLTQPTVSHHLKVLHDAGLLARTKRGTWTFYRLEPAAFATLREALGPGSLPAMAG